MHELNILKISNNRDVNISGIAYNSKKVKNGNIFVAIEGFFYDGHEFIYEAIDRGANAIVVQREVLIDHEIPLIIVKDTRQALAKLAVNFYDNPSSKFDLIGVTGTNGKTSITYMIQSIFMAAEKKTGIVGTIGTLIDGEYSTLNNTTPESLDLQQLFDKIIKSDTEICVIEVSSHSLELKRVEYCKFQVGIFSNLSKDHLDYHSTMENYFSAKKKLFYMTQKYNIINIDDKYGRLIIEEISKLDTKLLTYGIKKKADIYATDIELMPEGISYELHTPKGSIDVKVNIPGIFTVYNSLAAAACAYAFDINLIDIKRGLEKMEGVRGRFEVIPTNRDFTVIIDFAHTADALEKVLKVITQFAKGRKVIVFGAGGDRDISRRAPMGEVAGRFCDLCIVTSDNPRSEDPKKIIEDIIEGIKKVKGNYIAIVDRKEAIEYAIKNSRANDIILLAGKGHETYTIIGDKKLPFDEREIVKNILKQL